MSKYKSKTLNFLRSELKALEQTIKTERPAYRSTQSAVMKNSWLDQELVKKMHGHNSAMCSASSEYRTKHLIFGLLRGKSIDQMESNNPKRHVPQIDSNGGKHYCYCCNHPDHRAIEKLLPQYQVEFDKEKAEAEKAYLERKAASVGN